MAGRAGFEPGTPSPPLDLYHPTGAPTGALPPGTTEKLLMLRDRTDSLHRSLPGSEERREIAEERTRAVQRLAQLQAPPQSGGFNLDVDDVRCRQQQQLVAELTASSARLERAYQRAHAQWSLAARVATNVEDWLKAGRPGGTRLEDLETEPPKLGKGESLIDGIDRHRKRAREIRADLAAIEAAPFPSTHAKAQMRAQIEALAARGAPSVALLLKKDRELVWPTTSLQAMVFNSATPTFAGTEVTDLLGVLAWLHRDQLIAALEAKIDSESNDRAALTHAARVSQAAELTAALIDIERLESALVWRAMESGMPIEHRADCSPQAILQCRLVTLPA